MRRLLLTSALTLATGLHAAEDQPLGLVAAIDGDRVTITYQATPDLEPDTVLALYGAGAVEKHPLTGQVITQTGKLVAKAQILAVNGTEIHARVAWRQADESISPGDDAIPLPYEATPDAPPLLAQPPEPVSVAAQNTARISLPIIDPEAKQLRFTWELQGEIGKSGRLAATTTSQPVNSWTAPGVASKPTVLVHAWDQAGQHAPFLLDLTSEVSEEAKPSRTLEVFQQLGELADPAVFTVARAPDGQWWGLEQGGEVHRIDPGWSSSQAFVVDREAGLRSPVAVVPRNDRIYFLDDSARAVLVLDTNGNQITSIGSSSTPSDLVVADDGTLFIADQGKGGVEVYESDGRFRCRLGFDGQGPDGFQGLSRLARDRFGMLYALDARQATIQRFDRFHRRLTTWGLQLDKRETPVDLAISQDRLLVLLSSGVIVNLNTEGVASPFATSAVGQLIDRLGDPGSLNTDAAGQILVTYPRDQIIVRYDIDGHLTGIRGAGLWSYALLSVDGRGHCFGLNSNSGFIYEHDVEGWRLARFAGLTRHKGPFERAPVSMRVAYDGTSLVALDEDQHAVLRFDLTQPGYPSITIGGRGKDNGEFEEPVSLDLDDAGNIYVVDRDVHAVSVFDNQGVFRYRFGQYNRGKESHELDDPAHLAVTPDGRFCYIYDADKYEIQKFALGAGGSEVQWVTNTGGRDSEAPGRFYRPVGMRCDRQGLIYVVDSGRRDVQVIDFRGPNGYALQAIATSDLGIRSPATMGLQPDGMVYVLERNQGLALRW